MITHFRQAIEETLPWLSSFGADPAGGMTRLLYSPEWLETQQQFKKRMAASGLETRFDEVGNLYGRLSGTEYPQEVILSGSHIDTVVNGGNLDGQFGALAAWLAMSSSRPVVVSLNSWISPEALEYPAPSCCSI